MAYVPDNPELYEQMKAIDFINFICDIYEASQELRTNNLVGFVGNGMVQIEIGTRFCNINDGADYFLYYMLSKVFHLNIVNMEVGSGSLKELDLLIFMFPRLLQDAMRYTSSM